jgi:hypothetical protein
LLLLCVAVVARGQDAPKSTGGQGFVLGVNTYFDFGPPFNNYEIFIVSPAPAGSKVERFLLTPAANKCYAPEKTEYVQKTTSQTVTDLLSGVDPCKISEKALKAERKRRHRELNFSGAHVSLQASCGGETRTIETSVLQRDWFLARPGTPKNTSWTMELLDKLNEVTRPRVMDKPIFDMAGVAPAQPLSADPASLEKLSSGKYDSVFSNLGESVSEIYRGWLIAPPQPTVTLLSSAPEEPVHFNHHGELG